jgi:putative ABC transport system ATP-binding protein
VGYDHPVLQDASIAVHPGASVAIVGRSGSGKTTLLHCLAGLLQPQAGQVCLQGRRVDNLSEARRSRIRLRRFGFVAQFGELLPELTLVENIELPLLLCGMRRREARDNASGLMNRLGLRGLEGRYSYQVSGGEMQRAALARALVKKPLVLFADEPTGSLDVETGAGVLELLVTVARELSTALVLVTHDPEVATSCDRILSCHNGRLTPAASLR